MTRQKIRFVVTYSGQVTKQQRSWLQATDTLPHKGMTTVIDKEKQMHVKMALRQC